MKQSFKDILAGVNRDIISKVAAKLPLWADADLEYPTSLSLEQCSSSEAAAFKAEVAAEIIGDRDEDLSGHGGVGGNYGLIGQVGVCGNDGLSGQVGACGRIADLTGGLGSDSFAFAGVASEVWYNERDFSLCEAVRGNFAKLGVSNVRFNSFDISPLTDEWLRELRAFGPDMIYLDPARRSASGKKVFLLEDCSPDVVSLLPLLLETAPFVMVKLSPMADISMVCKRLGEQVRDVYIVGLGGECKELLCVIRREGGRIGQVDGQVTGQVAGQVTGQVAGQVDGRSAVSIHVVELGKGRLDFSREEEASASVAYPTSIDRISGYLLEPVSSLLKAGLRKLPCSLYGLTRLGRDTNLYYTDDCAAAAGSGLFKVFRIIEVSGFDRQSSRLVREKYPLADVSARGIPMTSDALRTRLGIRDANNGLHIFGAGIDCGGEKILVVCERER